jgi:hypothetical protein
MCNRMAAIGGNLSPCSAVPQQRLVKEATMKAQSRIDKSAEKPGRLELAILEWQRQLVRARQSVAAEPSRCITARL